MTRLAMLLLAMVPVGFQEEVIDLTRAVAKQAEWNILETRSGGPIGTWPKPHAHEEVALRLFDVFRCDDDLCFSLEIKNDRKVQLEIPVSLSSKILEKEEGTVQFRELIVWLGIPAGREQLSFKPLPAIEPVELFGSNSVAGSLQILLPGKRLIFHLRARLKSPLTEEVETLHARLGGSDVVLTPVADGYKRVGTLVPALTTSASQR